jgi:PAS domain S-box-containing protein
MSFVVGILPALYLQWDNHWVKGIVILLATEAASLLALALNQRGKSELAAETLSWAGLLCACSMVYFSREGYRDLALLLFPAMLATAALLLSKRPYTIYATFVVVAAATLISLQVHGLNPFARQSGSYFDLLNVAIILTLISFALGLLSNAMRRSVADHRALIEQAGEGVIVLDHRRLIRMCNSSAANILGVAARGLLGRSLQDFLQPQDLSILDATVAGNAGKVSVELTARHADGSLRHLLTTCTPRLSLEGRTAGVIVVLRDLTRHKEVEGALAESRQRFQALLEQGDLLTLLLDKSGTVTFCNDSLLSRLGIPREEMIGRAATDLLARGAGEEHIRDFEAALRLGKLHALKENVLLDSQGRSRWFQWSITPLQGVDGTITEVACVGFEITEQRMLREQYLQALKLDSIGRLAGGIAHDFNNLLTVINGYSAMLLEALPASDPSRGFASQIHDAGSHAASLTKQLLTFSRRQLTQPRATDLGAIVRESQLILERVIGEDIRLVTTLDPQCPRVMADPDQIRQVIMNLAVNARDAMPDGGELEISTRTAQVAVDAPNRQHDRPHGEYVQLAVTDSGVGMDEETMQHLFEPFFTTKGHGKGTGLGMATVYGIITQSRGWIDVASRPGSGTTVKVYLPRTDAPVSSEELPVAEIISVRGETVLIVEDQDTVRQLAAKVLKQHGYCTIEAASGSEAVQLLHRPGTTIDLLLTDVILPGINGRELADRIRGQIPTVKVLFMSGYAGDKLGRRGLLEDGLAFLPKPFTPAALLHKVGTILASER